jgi:CRP-like cAMP-binding protein
MMAVSTEPGNSGHLSTSRDRAELALPSSFVRFRKGEPLYRAGERAEALFSIVSGVVKAYTMLPDGAQHIVAFLFADDLVGSVQNGTHTNSSEALTAVTAYRMPMVAINARIRSDPDLQFHLISQLSHELHQAQVHAFLLSRQRAITRIGLFLRMLEAHQGAARGSLQEIYMPMKRSDIGAYAGISLEAVGRSFGTLVNRGAIAIRDRRHVQIINRAIFEAAIFEKKGRRLGGAGR